MQQAMIQVLHFGVGIEADLDHIAEASHIHDEMGGALVYYFTVEVCDHPFILPYLPKHTEDNILSLHR
jgi:hypothetical protein